MDLKSISRTLAMLGSGLALTACATKSADAQEVTATPEVANAAPTEDASAEDAEFIEPAEDDTAGVADAAAAGAQDDASADADADAGDPEAPTAEEPPVEAEAKPAPKPKKKAPAKKKKRKKRKKKPAEEACGEGTCA